VLTIDFSLFAEALPSSAGWEKNERQRPGSRQVNLSTSMNPIHLAETAVGLNLKLMKWRLAPEIDLESLETMRCLLLGAGTLGCNVARCLMVKSNAIEMRYVFLIIIVII
jgi:ubiquitin-like modifier-activating enzyme ATG7